MNTNFICRIIFLQILCSEHSHIASEILVFGEGAIHFGLFAANIFQNVTDFGTKNDLNTDHDSSWDRIFVQLLNIYIFFWGCLSINDN